MPKSRFKSHAFLHKNYLSLNRSLTYKMKKMKKIIFILITIIPLIMNSQDKNLPFYEIGDYPTEYTPTNVISRLIDGLGYRFYWSTRNMLGMIKV